MSFFIQDAFAASSATAGQEGGGMTSILFLVAFLGIFYLLIWMPQAKRMRAHRELITNLHTGDEVVTSGGILGRINKVSDDFIVLLIAENVEISVQKAAVSATVPKGTLKSFS
jgi:preprotein translocase subunit YajC